MSSQPDKVWRRLDKPPPYDPMNPPRPPQPPHPPSGFRKRQFRFSVRADIDLLRLVVEHNPYAAPHGRRLHKWQAIADTLRESGIDIDFRRARDRTALLLEQWRLQGLHRPGSGNHEDQAQKEHLLEQISTIEHAHKPRDSIDWSRAKTSRALCVAPTSAVAPAVPASDHTTTAAAAAAAAAAVVVSSDAPPLHAIPNTEPRPKFPAPAPFSAPPHQGHLPPLVQNHDPVLPQARQEPDLAQMPFAAPPAPSPGHQPEKLLKTNSGKRLSPRFSQPLFETSLTTPNPMPVPMQQVHERRSPRNDAYRPDLPVFRPQFNVAPTAAATAPASSLDPVHVPNSPRIGEGQNIQLDALPTSVSRSDGEAAHMRAHILKLERILDEEIKLAKQRLELDERRLVFERDRENTRMKLEKERIDKEFEDRKEEREDRRRREERDSEERERLLKIILKHQDLSMPDTDNPAP